MFIRFYIRCVRVWASRVLIVNISHNAKWWFIHTVIGMICIFQILLYYPAFLTYPYRICFFVIIIFLYSFLIIVQK